MSKPDSEKLSHPNQPYLMPPHSITSHPHHLSTYTSIYLYILPSYSPMSLTHPSFLLSSSIHPFSLLASYSPHLPLYSLHLTHSPSSLFLPILTHAVTVSAALFLRSVPGYPIPFHLAANHNPLRSLILPSHWSRGAGGIWGGEGSRPPGTTTTQQGQPVSRWGEGRLSGGV